MNELLGILGPVVIITAIGWVFGRSSAGLHLRTLSTLVLMVATPSLVFHTLVSMNVELATIGQMTVAALTCIATAGLLAVIALKLLHAPVRLYLPSLMLPNSGNLGLPLAALAFGEAGLKLGVAYFFVVALVQYSVGLSIASGKLNPFHLLRQPLIYSVTLVLLVAVFDLTPPQIVMNTVEILGGMMVPTMLIFLGSSLATLDVSDVKAAFAVALGRLVFGICAASFVIWLLGLEGVAAGVVFLLATMSSAIVTFVFAERYQQELSGAVAGAVVVSTLTTFMCLPGLIWIALWLANSP